MVTETLTELGPDIMALDLMSNNTFTAAMLSIAKKLLEY